MKKNFLITVSAVLLIVSACHSRNTDTKTEYYNPIGCDYNTVIEHFERDSITYMRTVSDLNNNLLFSWDSFDTINKCYYFNDDNICYRFQWIYYTQKQNKQNKKDFVTNWLNSNFKKMPDDSMKWKDTKQNLTYKVIDNGTVFSLWCNSDNYLQFNEQDDKIKVDYSNRYKLDTEEKEWYKMDSGEWSTFDEVADKKFEWKFSTDRFVIPKDLKGKIEHFRPQGKILTYEICYPLEDKNDMIRLIVKDEDDIKFCFAVRIDLLRVMIIYDDDITLFSNE